MADDGRPPTVTPPERRDAAFRLLQLVHAAANLYEQHSILAAALRTAAKIGLGLEQRVWSAEDILNQLRGWDMMDSPDGPYWRGLIDAHFSGASMEPPNFTRYTTHAGVTRSVEPAPPGGQTWQPIASAPEYQPVLVWEPRIMGVFVARKRGLTGDWVERTNDPIWLNPTHWMKLPERPI